MVPPNGPAGALLDVDVDPLVVAGASANWSTRSWSMVSQSVVPSSSPAAAAISSNVVNMRIGRRQLGLPTCCQDVA